MTDELRDVQRIGPDLPKPVRVVDCFVCHGTGWVELRLRGDGCGEMSKCAYCAGRGRFATEGGEA